MRFFKAARKLLQFGALMYRVNKVEGLELVEAVRQFGAQGLGSKMKVVSPIQVLARVHKFPCEFYAASALREDHTRAS